MPFNAVTQRAAIGVLCMALGWAPWPARAVAEGCAPIDITDADALRLTGTPLKDQSPFLRAGTQASVEADAKRSEAKRLLQAAALEGSIGEAERQLQAQGFACRFVVEDGVRAEGVRLLPAKLPLLRCARVQPASCICRHFHVVLAGEAALPERSNLELRQVLDQSPAAGRAAVANCRDQ